MDYRALQSEILTGSRAAECAPHVVSADMPKDASAYIKDAAIADILNAGRTRIDRRLVGDGDIALALGVPAGPIFLLHLESLAETTAEAAALAGDDKVAQVAIARQSWRSLTKGALDMGDPAVRAGLELFLGTLLTAEQVATLKALAEVPDTVTAADVSRALRGPWE